jgi:hypothetical protein
MDVRETEQLLFYTAPVEHFAKISVAGDTLAVISYPSRRLKAKTKICDSNYLEVSCYFMIYQDEVLSWLQLHAKSFLLRHRLTC